MFIFCTTQTMNLLHGLLNIKNSHIIPSTIFKFNNYKKITFFGGRSAVREFINVKDLAFIILLALVTKEKQNFITVGSGEKISIGKLVDKISNIMNFKGKIVFLNKIKDQTQRFCGSKDVETILKYKPIYNLDIGLKETVAWIKRKKNI